MPFDVDGRGILDFLGGTGGTDLFVEFDVGLPIKELLDVDDTIDLFSELVCETEFGNFDELVDVAVEIVDLTGNGGCGRVVARKVFVGFFKGVGATVAGNFDRGVLFLIID